MKNLLVVCLLYFGTICSQTAMGQIDPALELKQVLKNADHYDRLKEKRIDSLKENFTSGQPSLLEKIKRNQQIFSEYKKYSIDSAIHYTLRNVALANELSDQELQKEMDIQLAALYSTNGRFIESKDLLDSIDPKTLSDSLMIFYYATYSAYYSHYGQSNNTEHSFHQSELYRDSLLSVLSTESTSYKISLAIKQHYLGQNEEAEATFMRLLNAKTWQDPEYATIAYFLGLIFKDRQDIEMQTHYLSLSAISDIKNSTKDNASFQALALMYFDLNEIDQAYVFMKTAINDAIFCSVRYRTLENSSFYPIINASFQEKEDFKKVTLRKYLLLISGLSIVLAVGILYIYQQMRRLAKIKRLLHENNDMLFKLNQELELSNHNLFESNHIKEEYIANFFSICSAYIEKIENYRRVLLKKANGQQFDSLLEDLKSTKVVKRELEALYKNFDVIFLNLYPTFVEEFNDLLAPDQTITPKPGELLNTELRIFALIRLGITDSAQIATFLRYSLRTVYNYRTTVRNKAADARDELEEKVKRIATLLPNDTK